MKYCVLNSTAAIRNTTVNADILILIIFILLLLIIIIVTILIIILKIIRDVP